MTLTRTLREEHQVILRILGCFEIALRGPQSPDRSVSETLRPFVEFFRGFGDEWHHSKEEGCLFPALERAGLPHDAGPVGCMLQEHETGRAHVGAIAAALEAADAGAFETIVREGEAYIDMLRDHINKENNVLFEMADEMIAGDNAAQLADEFSERETDAAYVELSRKGRAIADRLMVEYENKEQHIESKQNRSPVYRCAGFGSGEKDLAANSREE